jgi:hypothetical protein
MVVLGLSIEAQDGTAGKELRESAERSLMNCPNRRGRDAAALPPDQK